MSRQDEIKRLITNHNRRLQILEEQRALHGLDTPPKILIEIEDIKGQLAELAAELAQVETPTSAGLPTAAILHNLPPRNEFVGRKNEKAQLHEALLSRSRLVSIDGIGGIGKTALALEVVYECLHASQSKQPQDIATFDGFIWTTAKDRELTLNNVLDTIALTLEYPGLVQKQIGEKSSAVDRLLRAKPYLLIVDNYETITDENVRSFLVQLPELSRALITTRERNLTEAWMISLKDLTEPEALTFIRSEGKRLGLPEVAQAADDILTQLYQSTSGAPLAIKWAIGQIKQKGQSMKTVLIALRKATASIFDNIFSHSWGLLSEDAQRVMIVMPFFATSATQTSIEAASDVHNAALDEALGQLVEMSLVDVTYEHELAGRRYSIHPLTRAYAASAHESAQQTLFVQSAFDRLLAYYKRLMAPPEEIRLGDSYWDGLLNYAGGYRFEPEWPNLNQLIRRAVVEGREVDALELFLSIVHFLNGWGLWDDRLELSQQMCAIANRLGNPVEAWLRIDAIGYILSASGQLSEIKAVLDQGRVVGRQFNLVDALILADAYEAWLYLGAEMRDIQLAQQRLESILGQVDFNTVFECDKVHQVVVARVVSSAYLLHWLQEDYVGAKKWADSELKLQRSIGEDITPVLRRLANLSLKLDDLPAAERYLAQASPNPRPKDLAGLYHSRTKIAERKGDFAKARRLCLLAIEQYTRLGLENQAGRCRKLLARLPEVTQHPEQMEDTRR